MSEPCIVLSDLKGAAQYCHEGARVWFREHNLSWNDLLLGKITIRELEALHDPLANRVIEYSKQRQGLL